MTIDCDLDNVRTTQFGVGRSDQETKSFHIVPAGEDVQTTLRSMASDTVRTIEDSIDVRSVFDPADKHATQEALYVPLSDDLATPLRALHESENLSTDSYVLQDLSSVYCYFVRITDQDGRRLTGVRRAAQFKAVKNRRMINFLDDTLKMATDPMFQLNDDFDVIVDSEVVHILHPAGFRALGQVDEALKESVGRNITAISSGMPFADWAQVEEYAQERPRAAALLASVRTNRYFEGVERTLLVNLCRSTGVEVTESNGQIVVPNASILGFLEVLDRRRYEIKVVANSAEQYKAASRRKIA